MSVISAQNVSICFKVGDFKNIGLKEYVMRRLTRNFQVEEFWADRNVTFSLEEGDMLGIIGVNGAGKSTLLKAVSRIMKPTEGTIKTTGTIAALLELTSGFDGDLTVRENTYLRGAMMGYTRKFMDEKYQEIIEFAELEDYQERMFKHLSSGMKSRLAFSIACLVEPDILILDEVLSVGDGAFRKKSGDKMQSILSQGVTGILVSHSVSQVRELCNKILWLDHGSQIVFSEDVELCCDAYEDFLETKQLPETPEDFRRFAEHHAVRVLEEQQRKEAQNVNKIRKALTRDSSRQYIDEALGIVKKYRPELLIAADSETAE